MTLVCDISRQYDEFSLSIRHAFPSVGVTALFGPSGSGKTSLLRVVAGFDESAGNYICFKGKTWQAASRFIPTHKRRLAYIFQEPSLFPHLNVASNLDYAYQRVASNERQFSPQYAASMLGIEPLLKRDIQALSGGERQRVAIARAVCSNPQIMLMDEPLSALDRESKRSILSALEVISRTLDIPIIYVSHSLDEVARIADHLVLMQQGQIIADGDTQAMLTSLDYPLARDVGAESLVMATADSHDDDFGMSYLNSDIGRISILSSAFKLPLKRGSKVRVLIAARDVSVTLQHQENTSILNIFQAKVDDFLCEDNSQVIVKSIVNGTVILARITKKSLQMMNLQKGDIVYLQAKSVALL